MKLSTIFLALAASANRKSENDGEKSVNQDLFDVDQITKQCSEIVTSLGGTFETSNNGFRGKINLDNYPTSITCKHVVQADNSCEAIKISYESILIEPALYDFCEFDGFRFGWTECANNLTTPARCNCFGGGCDDGAHYYMKPWDYDDYVEEQLGPTEFSINSNTFTFFFKSDGYLSYGHAVMNWECIDAVSAASMNIVATECPDSCSEHHSGYEEFGDRVRNGIERGLNNDIQEFSRKADTVTPGAARRVTQFKRWLINIFDSWYDDVTQASVEESRKCLTDNFPYDSPGNLDKESVSIGVASLVINSWLVILLRTLQIEKTRKRRFLAQTAPLI